MKQERLTWPPWYRAYLKRALIGYRDLEQIYNWYAGVPREPWEWEIWKAVHFLKAYKKCYRKLRDTMEVVTDFCMRTDQLIYLQSLKEYQQQDDLMYKELDIWNASKYHTLYGEFDLLNEVMEQPISSTIQSWMELNKQCKDLVYRRYMRGSLQEPKFHVKHYRQPAWATPAKED